MTRLVAARARYKTKIPFMSSQPRCQKANQHASARSLIIHKKTRATAAEHKNANVQKLSLYRIPELKRRSLTCRPPKYTRSNAIVHQHDEFITVPSSRQDTLQNNIIIGELKKKNSKRNNLAELSKWNNVSTPEETGWNETAKSQLNARWNERMTLL